MPHEHGKKTLDPLAPRSTLYQGPFGRLFSDLPPWHPPRQPYADRDRPISDQEADEIFKAAADRMLERQGQSSEEVVASQSEVDSEFDSSIPAGYTYFGQFIDHDITFDTASSLQRANDPNGLVNFRTPRLDLDNVYGKGASEQPYLYDRDDPGKFLIGAIRETREDDDDSSPLMVDIEVEGEPQQVAFLDLPRNGQGRALIGDMRNDENAVISQLQLAFLLAHNTLLDRAREHVRNARESKDPTAELSDGDQALSFSMARRSLRWLYQWIVWHDFLGRICDENVHRKALKQVEAPDDPGRVVWETGYDDVYSWKNQPYMPIEFSVAAYRFGHSMVRNSYQTNNHRGFGKQVPIFAMQRDQPDDLRGFRACESKNMVQWDWFLEMESSAAGIFPQRAHKIDTKLSNSLHSLHEAPEVDALANLLAFRNLKRGWRFELPSGSNVARALGLVPQDIDDRDDSLWFYVLKEAETQGGGDRLGPLGSILVAATFAGLLTGDPRSWINQHPRWTPNDDLLLNQDDNRDSRTGEWTLGAIIRLANVPVDRAAFDAI